MSTRTIDAPASAIVIRDSAGAVRAATDLAATFSVEAAERDLQRRQPDREIEQLSAAGLYGITIPREYGGADVPPSTVAEVVRLLATADPNIAQIPHSHFVYVNLLKVAASAAQQKLLFGEILRGRRMANAQSERNSRTVTAIQTTLRPRGAHAFLLDGEKFYCTGALFAQWIPVLARLDDPHGESGLAEGEYVTYVPADTAGVTVEDDWAGMGQRVTASGTVRLRDVEVDPSWVVPRSPAFSRPHSYGAFAQLLHAAIDVGIARGALDDAVTFVNTRSRPWFEAKVDRAADDPLLVQRFGTLAVEVTTCEAVLKTAAEAVDLAFEHQTDDNAAAASVAVATARAVSERASTAVGDALFEVAGTRSVLAELNLNRHWRNARTHTLHDPVRWKYQHIGQYVLNGVAPPRHGLV